MAPREHGPHDRIPTCQLTNQGASTHRLHHASVDRAARADQRGHRSAILWFTGLSGAGNTWPTP